MKRGQGCWGSPALFAHPEVLLPASLDRVDRAGLCCRPGGAKGPGSRLLGRPWLPPLPQPMPEVGVGVWA